jgi:hypothetical protein
MITLKIDGETKFFIGSLCYKCGGTGEVDGRVSRGNGSICFACKGERFSLRTKRAFDTREDAIAYEQKLDARRESAEARRAAKLAQEWEAGRAQRETEEAERRLAEEARVLDNASYKYLDSSIGDFVTVAGKVITAVSFDGKFGTQRLIVIETDNKELVKMFTTANWSWNVSREDEIVISGEVSSFDTYEGKAQTQIRKPKLAN